MNKFGNRKTTVDGIEFDSAKEAKRYGELKLLERAGQVCQLQLQRRYPIEVNDQKVCAYVADFSYMEAAKFNEEPAWRLVVEDVKSEHTRKLPVYRLKWKLMKACHGIEVREV